ncbi:MAG: nucleoside diphosphate kinase regulator [Verrucomicrobia bacterium]|nr:nucleoside diphosphate kinase regulator [Verrucomicrobiota bacterium]
MNHSPIYISREDYTKLHLLLATALHTHPNAARAQLRAELDRAVVINPAAFPADVVTMEATVEFEDLGTGEVEEYTITFPERADIERKRISILAPIGTALIGCRVGDVVEWSTPGGVRQLKVRRVKAPLVSAGSAAAGPAIFASATT